MNRTELCYQLAKEVFADHGVDTDAAIAELEKITIGIHAWQGDDVRGFEAATAHALTGGCQVTGNHPGFARTAEELRADLDAAMALIRSQDAHIRELHEGLERLRKAVEKA